MIGRFLRLLVLLLLVLVLSIAGTFVAALDAHAAVSLQGTWLAAALAFGVAATAVAWVLSGTSRAWLLFGVYAAGLAALPFVSLSPVKPFRSFHAAVRPGMTEAEVRAALDAHFPVDGMYRRPEVTRSTEGLLVALDRSDGRYDAEVVWVHLRDEGRVAGAEYHAD